MAIDGGGYTLRDRATKQPGNQPFRSDHALPHAGVVAGRGSCGPELEMPGWLKSPPWRSALDHDRLRFYLHLDPLTWG
ncbi:hypothetical protein OG978_17525 [Streptomyces sp. NBC_01591]|uniref:hypothetical protein n=1 Tax=Streptomyces sp. NBC_01591 TaxID=2975888 RepID=UPI002DD95281|nr:hypothetical protein [Streptomyces sp. NBC_01591]WSD69044.1 hypothetical protein OG978_17525 [Streptomyces sp. NBC_01591]